MGRARDFLHDRQAGEHFLAILPHRFAIFREQRFAFGAVGDDVLDLGIELLVGGKTRSAGADDAGRSNPIQHLLTIHVRVPPLLQGSHGLRRNRRLEPAWATCSVQAG